jgi:hypothetical protein
VLRESGAVGKRHDVVGEGVWLDQAQHSGRVSPVAGRERLLRGALQLRVGTIGNAKRLELTVGHTSVIAGNDQVERLIVFCQHATLPDGCNILPELHGEYASGNVVKASKAGLIGCACKLEWAPSLDMQVFATRSLVAEEERAKGNIRLL